MVGALFWTFSMSSLKYFVRELEAICIVLRLYIVDSLQHLLTNKHIIDCILLPCTNFGVKWRLCHVHFNDVHSVFWKADSPDPQRIPIQDAIGVTVLLLTCAYRGQEFVRIGYYINNEYSDPDLKENPPEKTDFQKVCQWTFNFKE